jgi:prophage antirepressor-like protein
MDTLGGKQDVTFLTEKGLYQVLFTSRKPIAKTFKNWVCEVKDTRLTGKYSLEKQLKEKDEQRSINIKNNFE